jgi:pimeloyl-ACP methyl ester carboxylesterase
MNALAREARALLRQASLLRHDLTSQVPDAAPDVAVLIHGFLATPGVLRPLRHALEAERTLSVASFTHPPGIGFTALAARIAAFVAELPAERIHLVGHSIGGLAARWYVQELGADPRVVQTLSLASPFWGVRRARLLPGVLGRELEPESVLLAKVRAGISLGVPHCAVSGSHDAVVGPPIPLGCSEEVVADGCGHNALLYDGAVLRAVVGRVRQGPRTASSD